MFSLPKGTKFVAFNSSRSFLIVVRCEHTINIFYVVCAWDQEDALLKNISFGVCRGIQRTKKLKGFLCSRHLISLELLSRIIFFFKDRGGEMNWSFGIKFDLLFLSKSKSLKMFLKIITKTSIHNSASKLFKKSSFLPSWA